MAIITKMSTSPAKPLTNIATEFTFKSYKLFSMFFTIFSFYRTTLRTNQFISFIWSRRTCWLFIHHLRTVFSSTIIWFFTFEAFKVSVDCHCILYRLIKVHRFFISNFLVFLKLLKFKTIKRFLFDSLI